MGDDGDSGVEGGTMVAEGRAGCESGESSPDDAQPPRAMQAVTAPPASMERKMVFMGVFTS